MTYIHYISLVFLMCFSQQILGQEAEEESGEEEGRHFIAIVLGHAHIPAGIGSEGNKQLLVLGSWGLDYDYRLNHRWAVGLHSDIVVENFELEEQFGEEEGVIMKRSRPLATTAVLTFKPGEHLTYLIGAGGEFAREENLFLLRLGLEYGWELPNEWELGISIMNDLKVEAYNSWVLGIGIGKFF